MGHKGCPRNDLYRVGWDFKPFTTAQVTWALTDRERSTRTDIHTQIFAGRQETAKLKADNSIRNSKVYPRYK